MSFAKRRRKVKERDRSIERALGVKHEDFVAERLTKGNVYSSADIELLEQERLPRKGLRR